MLEKMRLSWVRLFGVAVLVALAMLPFLIWPSVATAGLAPVISVATVGTWMKRTSPLVAMPAVRGMTGEVSVRDRWPLIVVVAVAGVLGAAIFASDKTLPVRIIVIVAAGAGVALIAGAAFRMLNASSKCDS